jgi:predicted NAD-dependent protein-ADP-ribosyltransferase YbiA (DUF1768 family)
MGKFDYPSVENAYQAAKSHGMDTRLLVCSAGEAKKLGKLGMLRPDWEEVKLGIMEDLLRQKFSIPELQEKFLATGDATLIEGNWWGDTFWGVCRCKGENHLGILLMKIRDELRSKE